MVDHYVLRQQVLLNLTTRKYHWRGDGTKGDKSMINMASKVLCSVKYQGGGKVEADEMVPQVREEDEEKAEALLEDVVDLTGEDEQMDRPDFNLDQGEPDLRRFWVQEDDCDIFFVATKSECRLAGTTPEASANVQEDVCFAKRWKQSKNQCNPRKYPMQLLPSICIFWRNKQAGRTLT